MNTVSEIDPTMTTIGQLVRRFPSSTRVFERLKIDYCCGGDRNLAMACAEAGISTADLLKQILSEHRLDNGQTPDWESYSLADLCRYIVEHYHKPLQRELPALRTLALRVAIAHGESEPALMELETLVREFADDIESHMQKEERVLFPNITSGPDAFTPQPVACMRREHTEHGARLARMATITGNFVAPEHACSSWHALCDRLRLLDSEIKAHVSLENSVLFPRALERHPVEPPAPTTSNSWS